MENLSQICAKIMQGPQASYTQANVVSGSAFLEILAMLNQTVVVETDVGEGIVQTIEKGEVEEPSNPEELMHEELIGMLLSQMPVQVNLMDETVSSAKQEVQPIVIQNSTLTQTVQVENLDKQPMVTQTNIVAQPIQVENIEMNKLVQKEVIPKLGEVECEKIVSPKVVVTEKIIPEKVVELVEKSSSNDIQKHFKVLNQNSRIKEIVKNDEMIPVNTKQIHQSEFVKKEVELTEVEMNQFKQSIDEMKMSIENMTKKDDETIVFKLKPEGLAEIVIKFEQKLGKVTLDISTSNRMVEQMIQKELPHLRDSLKSYQMEVNLSEMGSKNQSNQSHQSKPHQDRYGYDFKQEEMDEEEWMILPQTYGFNTYV